MRGVAVGTETCTVRKSGVRAPVLAAVPTLPLRRRLPTAFWASNSDATPRYRLDVQLDESLESLGLLSDETVSRERRILRARYQLVDLSSGAIVLDATAGSDAGIDVVSSDYATIAAERASAERLAEVVADQIVTRVSLALRRRN